MRPRRTLAALLALALPATIAPPPATAPSPVRPALAVAGRQFLQYDPGRGLAVEAVGNLAAARRIAVLVPGVGTEFADFDRGLGGVVRRAPAWQARALSAEAHVLDPYARVAVVAWLGYRPPAGVDLDAVREARARAGAAALVAFVRGLTARYPAASVTLIGHSYGAIVVGLAARRLSQVHDSQVHDLVALGAPGMGVDRAADLGGARVYAALAPHDWMRRVPQVKLLGLGHGRRPSSAGFGAVALPTGGVAGHDWYLVPGSATLVAVTGVVLGHPIPLAAAS